MTKKETLALLNYLFERYPDSKRDEVSLAESWYGAFQDSKPNGILYLCEKYVKEGGRFFPDITEIDRLRERELAEADLILKDPRNPYYQKVSAGAAARRQAKISRALWIKSALEDLNYKQLN